MNSNPHIVVRRPGLAVVILAGGRSRRMGTDKALLRFGDETLVERLVRTLLAVAGELHVAAGTAGRRLPPLPDGACVVHDADPDQGPLGGLVAVAPMLGKDVERLFVCGCDQPFLAPRVVAFLDDRLIAESTAEIVVPSIGGHLQVLSAAYSRSALSALELAFGHGERTLRDFVRSRPHVVIDEAALATVDPGLGAFRNLNEREDYEAALRELDE